MFAILLIQIWIWLSRSPDKNKTTRVVSASQVSASYRFRRIRFEFDNSCWTTSLAFTYCCRLETENKLDVLFWPFLGTYLGCVKKTEKPFDNCLFVCHLDHWFEYVIQQSMQKTLKRLHSEMQRFEMCHNACLRTLARATVIQRQKYSLRNDNLFFLLCIRIENYFIHIRIPFTYCCVMRSIT